MSASVYPLFGAMVTAGALGYVIVLLLFRMAEWALGLPHQEFIGEESP